jgi:hypothetical protein
MTENDPINDENGANNDPINKLEVKTEEEGASLAELTEEEKAANKAKWEEFLAVLSYKGLTSVRGLGIRLPGTVVMVGRLEDGSPVYQRFKHNPKAKPGKDVL